MKFKTFCEFFAAIESDPKAEINDFTIGDYLKAKNHVQECQECSDSCDRVLAKAPKDVNIIGFNKN